MKLKRALLVLSLSLFMGGCVFPFNTSSISNSSSSSSSSEITSLPTSVSTSSSIISATTSITTAGNPTTSHTSELTSSPTSEITSQSTSYTTSELSTSISSQTSSSTSVPSTSTSTSDSPIYDVTNIPINITAINDFHGQLDEDRYKVGITKMSAYLKQKKQEGNILINSGDSYQGSLICNYDKGEFVSTVFKDIGFDSITIGNHEFDWGVEHIIENEETVGKQFLGANIYKYPQGENGWEKAELGKLYDIVTLYEGTPIETKVGIIGVIGTRQITSITSLFVDDYIFLDPDEIVKELSLELREEKGCDIVIASYHANDPDVSIASDVYEHDYRYVDACFMGHSHDFESYTYNSVPFVQGGEYSQGTSEVSLSFNKLTNEVTLNNYGYQYLASLDLVPDEGVETALDDIKDSLHDMFYETVGENNTGHELDVYEMSRFYAKLSYDKATGQGYDLAACIFNNARQPLKAGEFTYSDLFETHPFLNDLYVLSVSDYDIYNQHNYSCGYINPDYELNRYGVEYHDVLVYNYNGFHIGVNDLYQKYYNYFPSAFSSETPHEPIKLDFNCFTAALEWLEDNTIQRANIEGNGFFG